MVSKFSNIPDKLGENEELREYELNRSDCIVSKTQMCHLVTLSETKAQTKLCHHCGMYTKIFEACFWTDIFQDRSQEFTFKLVTQIYGIEKL